MSKLAFVAMGAEAAAALLREDGWRVVDMDASPPDALTDTPDLVVGEVRSFSAPADLRRLTALHVLAPDVPMVVVTEQLDDGEGHRLYDTLVDVPIIRRGFESDLLAKAVASA
ncbi:MAG: hypothetical protein J7515_17320 [Caulobacter sp.]|nr:hypothetical protein [Caulobacter sp.]